MRNTVRDDRRPQIGRGFTRANAKLFPLSGIRPVRNFGEEEMPYWVCEAARIPLSFLVLPESLESVVSVGLWHIGRGIANRGIPPLEDPIELPWPREGPHQCATIPPPLTSYFPNHNVLQCHHHNLDSIKHTLVHKTIHTRR